MDIVAKSKFRIIISMLIWGTIGVFVREISLSSLEIAFFRALIGSVFLGSVSLITKVKIEREILKKNLWFLIFSGIALGINWILLFQAMKYTTISNAILSYYFAPVFIIIFSAILFKEKIASRNIFYLMVSIIGLFLIMKSNDMIIIEGYNHIKGILYGLGGAVIYAVIVILNKSIKGLSGIHTTLVQLAIATLALVPFVVGNDSSQISSLDTRAWIFIITLGIVHTGIAYFLYFSSIKNVKGKTVALLSYLDPIMAITISFLFLGESMNIFQIIGGILILSASYFSERPGKTTNRQ